MPARGLPFPRPVLSPRARKSRGEASPRPNCWGHSPGVRLGGTHERRSTRGTNDRSVKYEARRSRRGGCCLPPRGDVERKGGASQAPAHGSGSPAARRRSSGVRRRVEDERSRRPHAGEARSGAAHGRVGLEGGVLAEVSRPRTGRARRPAPTPRLAAVEVVLGKRTMWPGPGAGDVSVAPGGARRPRGQVCGRMGAAGA